MSVRLFFLLYASLLLIACAKDGAQGPRGKIGVPGPPGADGSSCSVEQADNGAVITCTNGTSAVILNGTNGQNGEDGADAEPTMYAVASIIKPCPTSGFREILLKLYNGDIIAHYSHGDKQFLTFLAPGNYVLTDGSKCEFTVNADMTVTW